MPPSPIVVPSVNEPLMAKLLVELDGIAPPRVKFLKTSKEGYSGDYRLDGSITIYMGFDCYDTEQLRYVAYELSKTLLHETRHHWQRETWKDFDFLADGKLPYLRQKIEVDAYEFEERRLIDYRTLVKVRRTFPSSPFSRLAATEARVRQSV